MRKLRYKKILTTALCSAGPLIILKIRFTHILPLTLFMLGSCIVQFLFDDTVIREFNDALAYRSSIIGINTGVYKSYIYLIKFKEALGLATHLPKEFSGYIGILVDVYKLTLGDAIRVVCHCYDTGKTLPGMGFSDLMSVDPILHNKLYIQPNGMELYQNHWEQLIRDSIAHYKNGSSVTGSVITSGDMNNILTIRNSDLDLRDGDRLIASLILLGITMCVIHVLGVLPS